MGSSRRFLFLTLLCFLTACSGQIGASAGRGADLLDLVDLASQAEARALEIFPDAVLKQVNQGRDEVRWVFQYANAAATRTVDVRALVDSQGGTEWEVVIDPSIWVWQPGPGIDIEMLRVGPAFVMEAAAQHWEGCPVRGLGLHGNEGSLTWYVFCNLPEGVVSGMVDGITGEFTASLAPPAFPPPTATPDCGQYQSVPNCSGLSAN